MHIGSPSAGKLNNLVFWDGQDVEVCVDNDDPPEPGPIADLLGELQTLEETRSSQHGKPESIYVTLFHGESIIGPEVRAYTIGRGVRQICCKQS